MTVFVHFVLVLYCLVSSLFVRCVACERAVLSDYIVVVPRGTTNTLKKPPSVHGNCTLWQLSTAHASCMIQVLFGG